MANQAVHLYQSQRLCDHRATVLTIASGKGGVGKTNITTNLAIKLARSGKKVLLLDADMSLGNVDLVMDVKSRYNITHLLSGKKTAEQIVRTGPEGVRVICGGSGIEKLAEINEFQRHHILQKLHSLQEQNDVILIDSAAGISHSVVGFCLCADQTLVVTTPEPTAITDAYGMIKVLVKNNYQGKIILVVNMADNDQQARVTYQRISNVVRRFLNAEIYYAGAVLRDPKLLSAVRKRVPTVLAYPKSRFSRSISTMAAKLSDDMPAVPYRESFFKKIADWLF